MADEPGNGHAFGALLRERRVAAGLSQEQLAELSGLGVRTIRELERGRAKRPHRESVALLTVALELSPTAADELARAGGQLPHPERAGASGRSVCPAQLPVDIPDFTGRLTEISELSEVLAGPSGGQERAAVVICAITGAGGIGKTSLAVHVAHRVRDRFPDGQLFIDLRGTGPRPLEPGEVLARFLRDMGVDAARVPVDQEERSAQFRSIVADRRVLVVLDNARDSEQVRPLLPGRPGCAVLVTSRGRLPGLPAPRLLDLKMLDSADARALLEGIVGLGRASAEPDAMAGVVAACAGLPLAIRIAGTRLVLRPSWTISTLADRLADHRRRLAELDVADLAVRSTFETSYRALGASTGADGADHGRVFRLVGLSAGPDISLPSACALLDQGEQDADAVLQTLVDAHLLDEPSAGRYRLHDLLRVYAAERAAAEETAQNRHQALRRLFGWQLSTLVAASQVLEPGRVRLEVATSSRPPMSFETFELALAWCEAEQDNLLASARQAAECGMDDLACQFGIALFSYLDLRGRYEDLVAISQIALASARVVGDRLRETSALNNLGLAFGELNQLDAATETLTEALALSSEVGGRSAQAAAWGNLGNVHHRAGRHPEALRCFQHTLTLARLAGHRSYERTTLGNLGELHNALGHFDQAAIICEQALAMCREDGDRHGEGFALVTLAETYRGLQQTERALATYQQAHDLSQQNGAQVWQGLAQLGLGDALRDLGRAEEARAAWQEALTLLTELGSPEAQEARSRLGR